MSYLSTSENVGFSNIPQNISDASCATQYKMAVEGVSGTCGSEVNMFLHDSSGDEQTYIPHLSDNFFHSKFKIDPNDLYNFHDSDVIASEITVSHTEDNYIFSDNIDVKNKLLHSPNKNLDLNGLLANGYIKQGKQNEKKEVVNGNYNGESEICVNLDTNNKNVKAKVHNSKNLNQIKKEPIGTILEIQQPNVNSSKVFNSNVTAQSPGVKISINSVNSSNAKSISSVNSLGPETFLDVFKREQGVVDNTAIDVKIENVASSNKLPAPYSKKPTAVKTTHSKSKRGRGPTVHEALQRIPSQSTVIALPNSSWHAPGEDLFQCGPLDEKKANSFRQLDSSSSDDDNAPDFETGTGPVCVEESAAESRSARLALRRTALRRHVANVSTAMQLSSGHTQARVLASLIKKQLDNVKSPSHLPTQTINYLLAMRGMHNLLSSQDRRRLRESGWSGGESGRPTEVTGSMCAEDKCTKMPLPCGRHCLKHVTNAPEQQLYAACAAVFAGGERCKQPLLPLQDQTPLCTEHAWKRDNYEQLSREWRPQKVRKRPWPAVTRPPRPPRPPRRAKRRRRLVPRRPQHAQSLSEINICSNSSTYDSSEDTPMGVLSESEYIGSASSHELQVEHVPPDDILDPSVLSQIPDEAFTEFFNQAEGGSSFVEGSELAAALEAVLDERVLDERTLDERSLDTIEDCVFTHPNNALNKSKIQISTAVSVDTSSSATS